MDKIRSQATPAPSDVALYNSEVVGVLNGLIETCKDGQAGFKQAAEDVVSTSLKSLFTRFSLQRADFAAELQAQVRHLGGDPEDSGSIAGALHRGWIDVKSGLSTRTDHAVLEECERGEDAAKKNYKEALATLLPLELQAVISRQYDAVRAAHDEVRALRDQTATSQR